MYMFFINRETLEQEIVDLRKDKEHLQALVSSVQRQSMSRIHTLQRQVSELGTQASNLQRSHDKIGDLCNDNDNTPRNSVDLSPSSNESVDRMTRSLGSKSDLEQPRRNRISYVEDVSHNREMSASFDDDVFCDDEPGTLTRSQSLLPSRSRGMRTSTVSVQSIPSHGRSTSPSTHKQNRSSGWGNSSSSLNHPVPLDSSTLFSGSNSLRVPVTPSRLSSSKNPFARGDPLRQSMPERKTQYVTPEQRKLLRVQNLPIAKVKPASTSSRKDSGFDSGHTSPDSPKYRSAIEQIMSTITSVTTTQIMKQHSFKMPKVGDKYKILVAKIVELQDRNQQLVFENSEIRRIICDIKYSIERIGNVEKKNIELDVENRRLGRICEALQGTDRNFEPRDSPYHYYSSV